MEWRGVIVVFIFGLLITTLDLFGSDTPAPVRLTLAQALTVMREKNPSFAQSREIKREGENLFWQSISKAGPTITGGLDYERRKDALTANSPRFGGAFYSLYEMDVEARQMFLRRGYFSALRLGHLEKQIRSWRYQQIDRDLGIELMNAFFLVMYHQEETELLKETKKVFEDSLRTTRRRQSIGRSPRLDVLEVNSQLALLEPRIQEAENNLLSATAHLTKLLALRDTQTLTLEGKLNLPSLSKVKETLTTDKARSPEVEIAHLERQKIEEESIIKLGTHWPKLEGIARFSRSATQKEDLFDSDANQWSFGLSLDIPLFSSFLYLNERGQTEALERQSFHEEQRVRDQNTFERIKTFGDLESAYSVFDASQKANELVKEAFQEARRQYERSTIDYLRLLSAQRSMLEGQLRLLQSKREGIRVLGEFIRAHGYSVDKAVEVLS